MTPDALRLVHAPVATAPVTTVSGEPLIERFEILTAMSELKLYGMKAAYDAIIASAWRCR